MAGTSHEEAMAIAGTPVTYVPPEVEDDEKTDVETPKPPSEGTELSRSDTRVSFNQQIGVTKIEALYLVFGKGWKLFALWGSVALIAYCWSLAAITTQIYAAFATSAFGLHTVVGTIAVITNIIGAITLPFLAKICDVISRPAAISLAAFFFTMGYLIVASAPTVHAVVAGEAIFTAGRGGLYQIMHILISDLTPLKWRGVLLGSYSLPFILNGFLAGEITGGLRILSLQGGNGWRWGYGMFCIIVPVSVAPSLIVMFWGDRKAKRLGALSLASSSYARRRVLEGESGPPRKTKWQIVHKFLVDVDAVGLILFTFSLALLLTPPTLSVLVDKGEQNPSLIAMYCIGGILFILFGVWERFFARHPICPRRLLNPTFLSCLFVDALHFFSGYLTDAYYNSWVYIANPQWPEKHYTYFSNIHNCGMSFFAACTGFILYKTRKYKTIQLVGIAIRCLGEGLNYMTSKPQYQTDAMFVMAKLLISMGAGVIVCTTAVAAPSSVPHADMASALAVLHMISQLGGSVAGSISASVWNRQVPANLKKYLPDMPQSERDLLFKNIRKARRTQPHDMVTRAYSEAMRPLLIAAICTTCLAFIVSFFSKEMHLGQGHNAVELHKEVRIRDKNEVTDEAILEHVREAEDKARTELQAITAEKK